MAFELEYRNTFIDVKDDEAPSSKSRSQSSPPDRLRISFGLEATDEEDAMRTYVGTLSMCAQLKPLPPADATPSTTCSASPCTALAKPRKPWSEEEDDETDIVPGIPSGAVPAEFFPLLPSQGSLGHPEVCRRPCIYFAAGHCENGNACSYCHMGHSEKTPKLDKRQRTIIQGLSQSQLLQLVRDFCRTKAEQAGFLHEAGEILSLLAEESAGARPIVECIADRDIRNLHKTLLRMNFSNLICLVTHQTANRASAWQHADRLGDALERLRRCFL